MASGCCLAQRVTQFPSGEASANSLRLVQSAPLYFGFAATGVGVALPGAVLPALAAQWHMNDAVSGRLFLMAWIGSSVGALLVHGSLRRTLGLACIACAVAAIALTWTSGHFAWAWMLLYGCGLGAAMTAISLIRQVQATDVASEFVRLNLVWAVGALLAPSLAATALAGGNAEHVFLALGAVFALLALWSLSIPKTLSVRAEKGGEAPPWAVFRNVPAGLIVMVALATGIEASAGGWLATYARRGGHHLAETIAAPTCLWAGLLLSRLVWSLWVRRQRPSDVLRASVALMAASAVLLLATGNAGVMLLAAFGLGFGLGPTYPLLLAWALRFQRGGAIFFLAGVGSSSLPWLTGVLSSAQGSLRFGLGVPCAAALSMLVLAWMLPLRQWRMEGEAPALAG
jgi:fucose permease